MDVEKRKCMALGTRSGHQIGGRNAGRVTRSQNTNPVLLHPSDSSVTLGKVHIR